MNRLPLCATLTLFAMVSTYAFAADTPRRAGPQRADAERTRAESPEVAELEALGAPRSVIQERKLQKRPDDSAEQLKAAEAYVLEAQDSPSKLDTAEEYVDKVLKADPNNAAALMLAGRIALLKRQPAVAQARYQAATAADPNNAGAFLALGQAWSQMGNDTNASAAFAEYRRLSGLAPLPAPGSQPAVPVLPGQAPPRIIGPGKDPQPARPPRR